MPDERFCESACRPDVIQAFYDGMRGLSRFRWGEFSALPGVLVKNEVVPVLASLRRHPGWVVSR